MAGFIKTRNVLKLVAFVVISIFLFFISCQLPVVEAVRPLQGDKFNENWLLKMATENDDEFDHNKKIELLIHHQSLQSGRPPVPKPNAPSCCTNFPRGNNNCRCPP
ncbi:hypothetical protein MKX01_026128 [Papaver californicum]|nr:hypothetical protein MKX01_026128 [Papaver californicum]